ncbi:hypothetical protein DUI87_33973 [Hirundo rustica rustica]|uniref:Murine leukemia virus integrase C-terminal domain-containing protein n=1 Tax=Hirundo rustica rustica TaxID=333673 RepID=A0A3M0INT1_HIRRU|nr:hypothetical protein DUI87_33973 [Hirundo rustica rustica]
MLPGLGGFVLGFVCLGWGSASAAGEEQFGGLVRDLATPEEGPKTGRPLALRTSGTAPSGSSLGPATRRSARGSKDYLEGEEVTRKYLKTIGQTLENLRKKGYLPQTSPLDANVHNINPGDGVLIKTWTNTPLTPKFEGPYQVLLTTHTAVRTEEKGWTHITRVKGPVPPPGENPSSAPSPDETEWTVTPHPKDLKLTFKKK